jgi:hypothetical protein
MIRNLTIITFSGIYILLLTGCLYRGDGVFKKIGDSDYKARVNFMNIITVADGRPTYVCGSVLRADHITPLRNMHVVLKKGEQDSIVSNSYTDQVGNFNMSGILSHDSYIIEIDSPEYRGNKVITVEPNRNNWHEIIALKR